MQSPDNYSGPYKNYLPGKKIRIVLGILVGLAVVYFGVLPLVAKIRKDGVPQAKPLSLNITLPSGDPTTRDSDGDTIPDWQEIAVGLDPHKKQTSPGVPDEEVFSTIKNKLGVEAFNQAASESTSTDRLSLTIANDIDQSAILNGTTIDKSISAASVHEILNYIESQKSSFLVYTSKDISVVENNLKNNGDYAARMNAILKDNPTTRSADVDIKNYALGTGSREKALAAAAIIQKSVIALKTTPVPSAAMEIHLAIMNALQGFYQTTQITDPTTEDEITRLGPLSLLQDYAIQFTKAVGQLTVYFSVALNKSGYIQ